LNKHAPNLSKPPSASDRGASEAAEDRITPGAQPFRGFPDLFWRRRWLIVALCAAATTLGVLAAATTAPKYSATAMLDGDDREVPANPLVAAGPPSEGEVAAAVRLRSLAMARRVAERLGLDADKPPDRPGLFSKLRSATIDRVPALGALFSRTSRTSPSAADVAARKLTANLLVSIEPRSSLISISYTSSDPAEAARIANTFVAEYLRDQKIRRISDRQTATQRSLTELTQTLGPKHPQVLRAQANLDQTRAQIQSEAQQIATMDSDALNTNGRVVPALASTIPLGRGTLTFVILGLIGGLVSGMAAAVLLELRNSHFRRALIDRWIEAPMSPQKNIRKEDL